MALTRLEGTERKLAKQPEIARAYQEVISSYEQKGYIREVQTQSDEASQVWYLPHFPVVREDKSTKEHLVSSLDLEAQLMPVIKTLGISWESRPDQFTYVVHPPPDDMCLTKRSFLSRTSTLFDPLGLVSPFTIRARMMIQAMWSAGLTWDERLPDELAKPALTWFKGIPDLAKIKVPRCLKELEQVAVCLEQSWGDTDQN